MKCSYCKHLFHIFPSVYAVLLSVGRETPLPHLTLPSEGVANSLGWQERVESSGQGRGRTVNSQMELENGYFNENYRESCSSVA